MAYSRRIVLSYWPIWLTHLTQGLHTTMPYVLSVYMVRGFLGEDADEEAVGYRVGILGAAFCLAQTFTSLPLGLLSDRIGRKPVIVLGNISCAVGVVLFGLSRSLSQALFTRLAMGATNGIIGAEKAYIGDNMGREDQAEAMSLISLTWGVGSLVGPLLGGALSGLIFESQPFLLPCLAASGISILSVISTILCLEEASVGAPSSKASATAAHADDETAPLKGVTHGSDALVDGVHDAPDPRGARRVAFLKKNSDIMLADRVDGSGISAFEMENGGEAHHRPAEWWRDQNVILALMGYTGTAFAYISLDEIVPLFASATTQDGGLGYTPQMLAGPLAFSGLVLIVWMLGGYKWLQNKVGTRRTCMFGLWMTTGVVLLFPLASVVPSQTLGAVIFWTGMGLKSISGSNAFTSCLVLVNLAAPKESLGQVNGAGQTLASGVRALGPWLGGILWSVSLVSFNSLGIPAGHQWVPFALPIILVGGCLHIYARLTINH